MFLIAADPSVGKGEIMEKKVDCRGLACPQPVLATKKALEDAEELSVLVDNPSSKENVKRFAESQGHQVGITEEKGFFELRIRKQEEREKTASEPRTFESLPCQPGAGLAVFIDSETLGRGSEELGRVLMRSFLHTLGESEVLPQKLIFMNSGVKLACEGSEAIEDLQGLAKKGVEILACGTCLDYFRIKDKLLAGRISNMYEISDSLLRAGRLFKV
jgi:selenium metabolism protein YedF